MNQENQTGKKYVAILKFSFKDSWFALPHEKRKSLTLDHVEALKAFAGKVQIQHLVGTGLSRHDIVEILTSDRLDTINEMMNVFKAGKKAAHAILDDLHIMEEASPLKFETM